MTADTTETTNVALDLFDAFATDTKKEASGVPTLVPGLGDTKWLIARTGNPAYNKLLDQLYRKNRNVLESKGDAAAEADNRLMAEVYAKTVLRGWEGKIRFQGQDHTYSYEVAYKLCLLKDLRDKFHGVATDMATFKAVTDEADVKN